MTPRPPDTGEIIVVSSNLMTPLCPLCGASEVPGLDERYLAARVNHLLQVHGLHLLHVGQQTIHGADGAPWHTTVAALGRDRDAATHG